VFVKTSIGQFKTGFVRIACELSPSLIRRGFAAPPSPPGEGIGGLTAETDMEGIFYATDLSLRLSAAEGVIGIVWDPLCGPGGGY